MHVDLHCEIKVKTSKEGHKWKSAGRWYLGEHRYKTEQPYSRA